ncbi:MAG: class I SAM-dependent methyltransferase [Burkholderiales bacterium]
MDRLARPYWDRIALRWRISVPLAPAPEDIDWFERRADAILPVSRRALLLGVTASIATMRWPAGTTLAAADWSVNMLKTVWPTKDAPPASQVVCADWRELPFPDATFELIAGDGCLTALGSRSAARDFATEIHRILVPGGTMLMRCFCQPENGIDPARLFDALHAGQFGNLDLFRWLLAVSLQGESSSGVKLDAAWQLWHRNVRDPGALQARFGWADDHLANVERMKGSAMTYWFPTLTQVKALAGPEFEVVEANAPSYEWGGVFPRLALRGR